LNLIWAMIEYENLRLCTLLLDKMLLQNLPC
jgi:hypothetical protein